MNGNYCVKIQRCFCYNFVHGNYSERNRCSQVSYRVVENRDFYGYGRHPSDSRRQMDCDFRRLHATSKFPRSRCTRTHALDCRNAERKFSTTWRLRFPGSIGRANRKARRCNFCVRERQQRTCGSNQRSKRRDFEQNRESTVGSRGSAFHDCPNRGQPYLVSRRPIQLHPLPSGRRENLLGGLSRIARMNVF